MNTTTKPRTYSTYVEHNQYGHALSSATSLHQNKVRYEMRKLPEPLQTKLYGVTGWVELTHAELCQIYDVKESRNIVGDRMMQRYLSNK